MITVLLFLFLNFVLFIPRYVFNSKTAAFFPLKEFFPKGKLRVQPLLTRFNEDVFRVNFEYALFFLLLAVFKNQIPMEYAKILAGFFYTFSLIFFLYHNSIFSIYKSYPSLLSDYPLIIQGVKIGLSGFRTRFFIGCVLFLVFDLFFFWANIYLVEKVYFNPFWMTISCCLIFFLGVSYFVYKRLNLFRFKIEYEFDYHHYGTIQSSFFMLNSNRFFSAKSKTEFNQIPNLIEETIVEIPENIVMKTIPNVYIIGIESYGAILLENELYAQKYQDLINELYAKLNNNDWLAASTLSETTVTGGTSWVSYGSLLKGVNIKSDYIYRHLINNQEKYKTQSFFTLFENLGYENYLVSGLGGFENYAIEWGKILSFFDTKNVIKYTDLEYKGERFNFGPSAPDQYLLNKSRALIQKNTSGKPFALFVETINSHYNFESPTLLLDDWETCNTASREDFMPLQNLSEKAVDNYFNAITYQLENLANFILSDTESNSIYVLFGDHQPPLITNAQNSYKTPVHIIAKDKTFIKQLQNKGFTEGMLCKLSNRTICHFEIKKLFFDSYFYSFSKND